MDKTTTTKLASQSILARLPVIGTIAPVSPTRMLSMVEVHDYLYHSGLMDAAKSFVTKNPNASLRDLQFHLAELCKKEPYLTECGTFLWGYYDYAPVRRALYEDAVGNFFVKLDYKWRAVFPIDRFGSLIGAFSKELKPIYGYFCSDNHRAARPHTF
jgi:hypothetical protein